MTFIFENDVNVALKSNKQNKHNTIFIAVLKVTDENSRIQSRIRYGSADPDPYQNVKVPQHWSYEKRALLLLWKQFGQQLF